MTEQLSMSEHAIVIEREFDAPRELVWKMWTDPDEVAKWWGPEHFMTPREKIEFDLRPGGVARMTMVGPDGTEYPDDGHFRVVEPPSRLAFGEDSTEHEMIESVETSVEFIDLGDGRTKVVVTSKLVCADELVDMAKAGWSSQLDKLVALLAA
ncbi:MAG TPA: SRPBCC domain-containing protein [Solirubrobacteraceae bacterium]|nr:SRPBCC domain-containing protein [Solirubrobacteraceae bacterium]